MTWLERIAAARKRGAFTENDRDLARDWPTCACGELDPGIPRDGDYAPQDPQLFEMGLGFLLAIKNNAINTAEELITNITRRAGEILSAQADNNYIPPSGYETLGQEGKP